jgi:hypothetical protein
MDLHNFKEGKSEEAASAKRPRNNSATREGEKEASSNTNPSKKRREDNKEREAGGHRDSRHWPPSGPHHQQERGFGYPTNRYKDRYGRGRFGSDNYHAGHRGATAARTRAHRKTSGSTRGSDIRIRREQNLRL